jgi:ABC-2 type transport system permease protein
VITGAFPALLISSLKAYARNRSAMFFSLLVPLLIMVIFGLLNLGGSVSERVAVVDDAHNGGSQQIIRALHAVPVLKVSQGALDAERAALKNGDVDLVVVLPADLPPSFAGDATTRPVTITEYTNQARPQDTAVAGGVVQRVFDNLQHFASGTPPPILVQEQPVSGKNLTYVDFLVPGIISLSIMQTGIFSVGFALVAMKRTGILRRLMATPMNITDFMVAQVGTRMIMSAAQVVILLSVALLFFKFHMNGNALILLAVAILGSGIFIAIGFAIAGYAKSEDAVPALANIVVLPMMFLSGVFFSRNGEPDWLHRISDYLPLTFLTDAIRGVSVDGASLWTIRGDLLGIAVWVLIAVFLATRLFRWEVG